MENKQNTKAPTTPPIITRFMPSEGALLTSEADWLGEVFADEDAYVVMDGEDAAYVVIDDEGVSVVLAENIDSFGLLGETLSSSRLVYLLTRSEYPRTYVWKEHT